MQFRILKLLALICLLRSAGLQAFSLLPASDDQRIQGADSILRGKVMAMVPFENPVDGCIHTRATVLVEEVFKGAAPAEIVLSYRGGSIGERGEADSSAPRFRIGSDYVLFVSRRADGSLGASHGPAGALLLAEATRGVRGSAATPPVDAAQVLSDLRRRTSTGGPLPGADLAAAGSVFGTEPVAARGPIPVKLGLPVSNATNLMTDDQGIGARFVLPDRGEPIPYVVDADYLPAGITLAQGLAAVTQAIAVWTNASSVRFTFAGKQSFGMAASNVKINDGVLRIQLHDHYGVISGGFELGVGGHGWTVRDTTPGWTTGGNVLGNDFHRVTSGFVVLEHTAASMQNLATFTEVLTHEIGHAIGLDHSSENSGESNSLLKQACMYYMVHSDGRGARLNDFDINVCRQIHPVNNTPPWCYDRAMDVVSSYTINRFPPANTVDVRGYDLQGGPTSLEMTPVSSGGLGAFEISGNTLTFVPKGAYNDSPRIDPPSNSYYEQVYVRVSDGANASPFATVKVVSLNLDSYSEGIPDSWRAAYFESGDPSAGPNRHASQDFDGDGYSNIKEYLMGSDPSDPQSNLVVEDTDKTTLRWPAKAYEVYEVQGSDNLVTWTRAMSPVVPTNSIGMAAIPLQGQTRRFFRIEKVP